MAYSRKWLQKINDDLIKSYKGNFVKPLEDLPKNLNCDFVENVSVDLLRQTAIFSTQLLQRSKEITCISSLEIDISKEFEKIQRNLDRGQKTFEEYINTFNQKDARKVKSILSQREKCDKLLREFMNNETMEIYNNSQNPAFKKFADFLKVVHVTTHDFVDVLNLKLVEKEAVFERLDFTEKEKQNESSRSQDYDQLKNNLRILSDFKLFGDYNKRFVSVHDEAVKTIVTKLESHYEQIKKSYLESKKKFSEDDCIKINKKIENLRMISDKFPICQKICE